MKAVILKKITDSENGIESRLVKTDRGLVVGIWDIDCNKPLSDLTIFGPDHSDQINAANEYFARMNATENSYSVRIL